MSAVSKKTGFTLIEMLVVITIMGLLLGISIASFSGMGKGVRVNAAYEELTAAVRYARMYAIANNDKVYLVFWNEDEGVGELYQSKGDWPKYWRGYTAFATGENEFIMETKLLPPGLIFLENSNPPSGEQGVMVNSTEAETQISGFDVARPGRSPEQNQNVTLHALAFMPDGTVTYGPAAEDEPGQDPSLIPFWIAFSEGFTNAEEAQIASRSLEKKYERKPGDRTMYAIKVNPLSGHVEREEYPKQ